ncbi:MAG TPA: hypothetical protein DDZ51_18245 [Planctomycetaceae bacterium]|nr:hypothetical protein [Planctomycetaceae bacterium]
MGLLYLCPTCQSEILSHPPITSGHDPITDRDLHYIVGKQDWRDNDGFSTGLFETTLIRIILKADY